MREKAIFWLLFSSLALLTGCAGMVGRLDAPRVSLVNIDQVEIQLLEQRYRLTLRIQNPNRQALQINGLSFRISINGQEFAEGVSDRAVSVGPFAEATTQVTVSSGLFDLIRQLNALDQRPGEPLAYRISGHISVAGQLLSLPFEQQGQLGGRPARQAPPTRHRSDAGLITGDAPSG